MMRYLSWILALGASLGVVSAAPPPAVELADLPVGGRTIPSAEPWRLRPGFTIDLQFRMDSLASANLVTKEGEYLIRVDGSNEGGKLSIYLALDGNWEPRLRTIIPAVGPWHRVTVAWDGSEMVAVVDGRSFRQRRPGNAKPGDEPVILGAQSTRAGVLDGAMRAVRIHHRAVTEGELLADLLGLTGGPAGGEDRRRFDFRSHADGWAGRGCTPAVRDRALELDSDGGQSALVRTGLAVPLTGEEQVGLRLQVAAGEQARLVVATSAGTRAVPFDLLPDGLPHTYLVPVDKLYEWQGTLQALAVVPTDQAAKVRLEAVEIAATSTLPPEIAVTGLHTAEVILRAGRPLGVVAELVNRGGAGRQVAAALSVSAGMSVDGPARRVRDVAQGERWTERWSLVAAGAMTGEVALQTDGGGATPARTGLPLRIGPALALQPADYVPAPRHVRAKDELLIGAQMCPLWKTGERSQVWEPIVGWPDRTPALGYYDEGSPEVTDWEITWCLEHGIDYFVYCWYRARTGAPIEQRLSHGIHEGLFNARYGDQFKFAIMWENGNAAGVADEADLFDNLLPYWIETYFKRANYLQVDGKPVLYVYRPEKLVDDLGGVPQVRAAFAKMRQVCREAGFAGLWILGEYRGLSPERLKLLADEGLDASFAYCWPVPNSPPSATAVEVQADIWRKRLELGTLPDILTVSMGWDSRPWHPSDSIWRLTPEDFQKACELAVEAAAQRPAGGLGRRMILLDNWNEYGEGHYVAPHRHYGFGYLDAARNAFCDAPAEHLDLVPEDVGRGPYDTLYRQAIARRAAAGRVVTGPGGDAPGLLAWYTFDDDEAGLVLDYSGHGRGAVAERLQRAAGRVGQAAVCDGGAALVSADDAFAPERGLTIEAWIRTAQAGQRMPGS